MLFKRPLPYFQLKNGRKLANKKFHFSGRLILLAINLSSLENQTTKVNTMTDVLEKA
jgi:hypothetical protein